MIILGIFIGVFFMYTVLAFSNLKDDESEDDRYE